MHRFRKYLWESFQILSSFQDLIGPGAHGDRIGEEYPADNARRIDEEFRRTGDIRVTGPSTGVQQVVAANGFEFGIAEECEGKAQLATVPERHFRLITTDSRQADTTGVELGQMLLKTPQLGVAKRSPMPTVEHEQDRLRFRVARLSCHRGKKIL